MSSEDIDGTTDALARRDEKPTGIATLISEKNLIYSPEMAAGAIARTTLKKDERIFIVESRDGSAAEGKVRDERESRGTIWPSVNITTHPSYIDTLDNNKAWGRTLEEATERAKLSRKSQENATTLADFFNGDIERASAAFPIDMTDAAAEQYAQHLTEGMAFMACLPTPDHTDLSTLVRREKVIPAVVFNTFRGELEIIFTKIKTMMGAIKILAGTPGLSPEVLQGAAVPISQVAKGLVQDFVAQHKDELSVIHRVAMDEKSGRLAHTIVERLGFGRPR